LFAGQPMLKSVRRLRYLFATLVAGMLTSNPGFALIDAKLDDALRYQAVVILVAGGSRRCTVTKIAPRRFLTAGHCVTNTSRGTIDETFAPGRSIRISNALAPDSATDFLQLHVDMVHLPAEFERALKRLYAYQQKLIAQYRETYSGAELERRVRHVESQNHFTAQVPDLAIVTVRQRSPEIPQANIDFAPLAKNEPVHLVGYGCERFNNNKHSTSTHTLSRRKWGETQVIRVDAINFYTFAHLMRPGAPSLCPGDSGGPVMRNGKIVGVHGTVYGITRTHGARSNMSANLRSVQPWLDAHRHSATSAR
jgi:V8-like Glu-specific endopeptidase